MRVVLQRVSRAEVRVDGRVVGAIGPGYLALVGVAVGDGEAEAEFMARKIAGLRLWPDEHGKMNLALGGEGAPRAVLAVSQFTLLADAGKGMRPSFDRAAPGVEARPVFEGLLTRLREHGLAVESGVFGAHMQVELVNDGPVTIIVETPSR